MIYSVYYESDAVKAASDFFVLEWGEGRVLALSFRVERKCAKKETSFQGFSRAFFL